MSNFFNNKRRLLTLGTLVVAATIVLGAGFAESFGSKSSDSSKASGSWRSLPPAPDSIAPESASRVASSSPFAGILLLAGFGLTPES